MKINKILLKISGLLIVSTVMNIPIILTTSCNEQKDINQNIIIDGYNYDIRINYHQTFEISNLAIYKQAGATIDFSILNNIYNIYDYGTNNLEKKEITDSIYTFKFVNTTFSPENKYFQYFYFEDKKDNNLNFKIKIQSIPQQIYDVISINKDEQYDLYNTTDEYLVSFAGYNFSFDPLSLKINFYEMTKSIDTFFLDSFIGDDNQKYYFQTKAKTELNNGIQFAGFYNNIYITDENFNQINSVTSILDTDKIDDNLAKEYYPKFESYNPENHDIYFFNKDHYIVSSYILEKVPSFKGGNEKIVFASYLQEVKNDKVVWEWKSTDYRVFDYLNCVESNSDISQPFDYFHFNSIELDKEGNLLISSRNTSSLIKIKRNLAQYSIDKTSIPEIEWIITNDVNNISNNNLIPNYDKIIKVDSNTLKFSTQHHLRIVSEEENNITMSFYNNMDNSSSISPQAGESNAVLFKLNQQTRTISNVKQNFMSDFNKEEAIYATATGCTSYKNYIINSKNIDNWATCWGFGYKTKILTEQIYIDGNKQSQEILNISSKNKDNVYRINRILKK